MTSERSTFLDLGRRTTNSLANLCTGARLRGGNEYAVTAAIRSRTETKQASGPETKPRTDISHFT